MALQIFRTSADHTRRLWMNRVQFVVQTFFIPGPGRLNGDLEAPQLLPMVLVYVLSYPITRATANTECLASFDQNPRKAGPNRNNCHCWWHTESFSTSLHIAWSLLILKFPRAPVTESSRISSIVISLRAGIATKDEHKTHSSTVTINFGS